MTPAERLARLEEQLAAREAAAALRREQEIAAAQERGRRADRLRRRLTVLSRLPLKGGGTLRLTPDEDGGFLIERCCTRSVDDTVTLAAVCPLLAPGDSPPCLTWRVDCGAYAAVFADEEEAVGYLLDLVEPLMIELEESAHA